MRQERCWSVFFSNKNWNYEIIKIEILFCTIIFSFSISNALELGLCLRLNFFDGRLHLQTFFPIRWKAMASYIFKWIRKTTSHFATYYRFYSFCFNFWYIFFVNLDKEWGAFDWSTVGAQEKKETKNKKRTGNSVCVFDCLLFLFISFHSTNSIALAFQSHRFN